MEMQETALATIDQNAELALASFNDGGIPDDVMFKPSTLQLVQPISPAAVNDGAKPGTFRDTQSNMEFSSIQIVALDFYPSRVLFPPGGELGVDPICRSSNGLTPVDDPNIVKQCSSCEKCPHASWANYNQKTKQGAPDCKEKLTLLCAERDTDLLYRITGGGMSLRPMKDFRDTLFKLQKLSKGKVPWRGFNTTLETSKIIGKKGTFYVLKFSNPKALHPEDLAHFAGIYAKYQALRNKWKESAEDVAVVENDVAEYVAA